MNKIRNIARSSCEKTFQGVPQILNEVGDKISLELKDLDGVVRKRKAEVMAIYDRFVLLLVDKKYKTTVHVTDFEKFKGAKVLWPKA